MACGDTYYDATMARSGVSKLLKDSLLPRFSLRSGTYCIIPASGSIAHSEMGLRENQGARCWRGLLIALCVLTLGVTLTTRFSSHHRSLVPTVKSVGRSAVVPQKQRMNRDAAQWIAPIVVSAFAQFIVTYSCSLPAEPQVSFNFLDDRQFNRPPPSLQFLS